MTRQPIGHHGPTHLPWGEDPIPGWPLVWPVGPTFLPLSGIGNQGPFSSQSPDPPPDHWDTTIDSTCRNNFKLAYTGSGTGKLIWPIVCGPGDYTLWIDGGGSGTLAAYIAGAYPTNTRLTSVPSGDWILQSSWNLGAALEPYLRRIQDFCSLISGGPSGVGWAINAVDGGAGVSTIFQRSTSISGGTLLNGGPGYFFLRLDVTPGFQISEAIIEYDEP
jgi:hypothetical protein